MMKISIFNTLNSTDFEKLALEVFQFQAQHNAVYKQFIKLLKVNPLAVDSVRKIPFLPIEFF